MEATTMQQTTQAPIEDVQDVLLCTGQQLTDSAYDRFTQGKISRDQLRQFYVIVRVWSKASEDVLEVMQRFNIKT